MVEQTAYALLPEDGDAPHPVNQQAAPRERSIPKMRNDTAASGEFRINLPPDVLAEARRQTSNPRAAMQVDGFRPGLFGRLFNLVTGRRR
jgi:hypothetical protein